jgi:hypothetical protein
MCTTIAVLALSTVVCSVDGGSIRFALTYGNDMVLQQGLHFAHHAVTDSLMHCTPQLIHAVITPAGQSGHHHTRS